MLISHFYKRPPGSTEGFSGHSTFLSAAHLCIDGLKSNMFIGFVPATFYLQKQQALIHRVLEELLVFFNFHVFFCRYKGPLLEEQILTKAAEAGLSSPEFSELCVWLGSQIKSLCNLEESITSAGIAIMFSFLLVL